MNLEYGVPFFRIGIAVAPPRRRPCANRMQRFAYTSPSMPWSFELTSQRGSHPRRQSRDVLQLPPRGNSDEYLCKTRLTDGSRISTNAKHGSLVILIPYQAVARGIEDEISSVWHQLNDGSWLQVSLTSRAVPVVSLVASEKRRASASMRCATAHRCA